MTWAVVAVGVTATAGYMTAEAQRKAQEEANKANIGMTETQTAEQARQFGLTREDILERDRQAALNRGVDIRREGERYADITGREQVRYEDIVGREQARYGGEVTRGREAVISKREREDVINQRIQGQFKAIRQENLGRLSPYATAGQGALTEQQALLGLSGEGAQREAYGRFTESPGQAFLRERQERAVLRNAAAMGGLGGGNVRTALQEQAFARAQTDLDRQLGRLGVVSGQGLTAVQESARTGYGPGYVSTGTDVGVHSGTGADISPAVVADSSAPELVSEADTRLAERKRYISNPTPRLGGISQWKALEAENVRRKELGLLPIDDPLTHTAGQER